MAMLCIRWSVEGFMSIGCRSLPRGSSPCIGVVIENYFEAGENVVLLKNKIILKKVILLKKKKMVNRTHMVVLAVCLLLSSITVLVSRQVRCKLSSS